MPAWFIETLKDPIFQLSAVVFVAALVMLWWMIFQIKKSTVVASPSPMKKSADGTIVSEMPLTQEAKFQLMLENVIAINRRLDDIEKRLSSAPRASGASPDTAMSLPDAENLNRKLDAIYKILSSLSTKDE